MSVPLLRVLAAVTLAGAAAAAAAMATRQEPFPHERHTGLFPLCEGCHGDVATNAPRYPAPETCVRCHDGEREARVAWEGPAPRAGNLRFSHPGHATAVSRTGEPLACAACHAGGTGRMEVGPAQSASCQGCHAHAANDHFAARRDCAACHVPLVDAATLDGARIAAFPAPVSHEAGDFGSRHAAAAQDAATCAVCHARESCTRCHANGAALPAVQALRPDARVAALERSKRPDYPAPLDHAGTTWDLLHGSSALETPAGCANCHTRDSCATCHGSTGNAVLAALPERAPGDPRGVTVPRRARRVHAPGYTNGHTIDAAARDATCTACHERTQCEACHTAGSTPDFHAPDFLATHGPAAWSAENECVSCHSTEVFCRSCHEGVGLGARDRPGIAFHTGNPFWLFGHGTAARQGLENCATCHAQQSCMRCHSARGSWRVSPHGPGFDPARARDANPVTCRLCHPAGGVP